MKKSIGILSIFLLLLCFSSKANALPFTLLPEIEVAKTQYSSAQNTSIAHSSIKIFFQLPTALSLTGQGHKIPLGNSKKPSLNTLSVLQTIGNILASTFLDYQKSTYNMPFRFRKSDLIFPFHYFW